MVDLEARWTLASATYLWATINGFSSIYADISQGVVTIQLNSVELSQFDRVGVSYGGHARANVKPKKTTSHYNKKTNKTNTDTTTIGQLDWPEL